MVELSQMLAARDRRVERQNALLRQYGLPLVSFTLNIAGPVKNSPDIRRLFSLGRELLLDQLLRVKAPLKHREETDEETGCEGLYVVDAEPAALKALCCELEERTQAGRLFDLDVLCPDGRKLDRPRPRRCLICGGDAKDCARSRTHSVPELQAKTRQIIRAALDRRDSERAASLAVRALLYEVTVTPKPGLVDRENNGSHRDMDTYTFMASASTLWPYFATCTRLGQEHRDVSAPECFAALRFPGKLAEGRMLHETFGVNTHKGAIFTMGLACGALGRLDAARWTDPAAVLAEIAAMTVGVERELTHNEARSPTAGERFYRSYGLTGVRGQAALGFPTVLRFGLPALESTLAAGRTADEAGTAALLALIANTPDTNMISRGGYERATEKQKELRALLAADPCPGRETLKALDRAYIAENLSPGGSADLLGLSWLLHFLKEDH